MLLIGSKNQVLRFLKVVQNLKLIGMKIYRRESELNLKLNSLNYSCYESTMHLIYSSIAALTNMIHNILNGYLKSVDLSITKSAEILDDIWLICPNCSEAWKSTSENAMVICATCNHALHNPRYKVR